MKSKILLAAMCVSFSIDAMDQRYAQDYGCANNVQVAPLICYGCENVVRNYPDNNQPNSIELVCHHTFHISCLDKQQHEMGIAAHECPWCIQLSSTQTMNCSTNYTSPTLPISSVRAPNSDPKINVESIASNFIALIASRIQDERREFNSRVGRLDYNKYVLSIFAEGAAWGSTMYLLYKACMLQELSGMKWWAIQGIATAATLKFAKEMDLRHYVLKYCMVLWLAQQFGYTQNIAHLCLLNSAMSWWVPLSKYVIAQTNKYVASYNYPQVRKNLARNYRQRAILLGGNIAGACIVGPLLNSGLKALCTFVFEQAEQALRL